MRVWHQYLLNHSAAADDFVQWVDDVKSTLQKEMMNAVKLNNKDRVYDIAIEMHVYDNMQRSFLAERRELAAIHPNERS